MLRHVCIALIGMGLFCITACGGRTGSAAKMPDGKSILINVYFDSGVAAEMDDAQAKQRQQLASWMQADLINMIQGTGYNVVQVADPATPTGPGRYLLRVHITNYNAGSKAARMFVGFGAGAVQLDTHFELVGKDGEIVIAGDPSVGSGRDWKNAARKVNENTVDAFNAQLNRSL